MSDTGSTDYGVYSKCFSLGTCYGLKINMEFASQGGIGIDVSSIVAVASTTTYSVNLGGITGTAASSNNYGINIGTIDSTGTANYGMHITQPAGATHDAALVIGTVATSAGDWSLYNASTADSYFAGNVGIGTTSPGAKLEIAHSGGGSTSDLHISSDNAVISTNDSMVFQVDADNNQTDRAFYFMNNGKGYSNGSFLMSILENGKVGIGTTSPTSRIHGVTTLSAATGNEVAYQLNYTTNKLTSGNDTGLLINMTDTASPGTSYLIDAQVGGVSKFSVRNDGLITTPSNLIASGGILVLNSSAMKIYGSTNSQLTISDLYAMNGTNLWGVTIHGGTSSYTQTSGSNGVLRLLPTYNQTSGTAANTDLLINRTQTAIGSGAQLLIDAQVGSVSQFNLTNKGQLNLPIASLVSQPILNLTGTWFTGGTATTTKPHLLIEPTGTTSTAWSTSGTGLGINAASGFAGNLIDAQLAGTNKFKVDYTGRITNSANIYTTGALQSNYIHSLGGNQTLRIQGNPVTAGGNTGISLHYAAITGVSGVAIGVAINTPVGAGTANQNGTYYPFVIAPVYDQPGTPTAANTDLLINRTQTAVGSGAQLLIDAQVGGVSKFSVSNAGATTIAGTVTLSSVGAMDANDVYVCIDPVSGVLTTGATCTASSLRYKKNIAAMTGGLNTVMQLRPVTFDWKYNNQPGLGFIAEEVEKINPILVTYDDEGNVSGLHYDWMSAILAKAIQEQQTSIAGLTTNESVQTQNLASLQLKTDENITTIQQLQKSIDEELAKADLRFKDNDLRIADLENETAESRLSLENQESRLTTVEGLIATLQSQMDELKKLTNQELNVAQIEANKTDIDYLKLVLGLDHTENGSLQILGNLEADGVVAGVFTVKVIDEEKKTIGTAKITPVEKDEDDDGKDDETGSDGKSVVVKTKAVTADSKIFVTPEQPVEIGVNNIKSGESFQIEISQPLDKDLKVDWWIILSR